MAAEPTSSFAFSRPAHVGEATLFVQDLAGVAGFYRDVIGLGVIEQSPSGVVMGTAGRPLLHLLTSSGLRAAPGQASGLFHTAFLMPDRAALGRWLVHAAHCGVALEGASDHLVSEAIYLSDPEGNGIEIYADRPHGQWTYTPDGLVKMDTLPFDLQALYDATPKTAWQGMEDTVAIGHLHLKVGNVPEADRFFEQVLGLKKMAGYPSASFYATGDYHHHVAANVWMSKGAGARSAGMSGLSRYSLTYRDKPALERVTTTLDQLEIPTRRHTDGLHFSDPWGMEVVLKAA